jgi:dimethylargininase
MKTGVAITREVSGALARCELTHLERSPIDVGLARAQHALYTRALEEAGYRVEQLPADDDMPDSVFVEDIAVVFDELAVIARPGAPARRGEVPAVVSALGRRRELRFIEPPATLDGGDVMVAGRRVFVGRSSRTNADAVRQMRRLLAPHGYSVCEQSVSGCLHLKSAVTCIDDGVLLANPRWIDAEALAGYEIVSVDPGEPSAANALRLADRVVFPTAFPRTAARLADRGLRLALVDASELAKAEGAVTCCSLIVAETRG